MRPNSHAPIGVFDSGVGGLTVLKALMERLPNESTVYLGDTARVPYGTKSPEVVTKYSLANAHALLAHDIKLLVVACNTASASALPALQAALPIPVIGVIEPGAAAAARTTHNGHVAVIGTPGTIASGAYQTALANARPGLTVHASACPLFVPLAEEGWLEGEVPRLVAQRYLTPQVLGQADTLVLGCTHYPLLNHVISQVVGNSVRLVDSATATAEVVAQHVTRSDGSPQHTFLVTDTPARFMAVGSTFLGRPITQAQQIDLQLR
jgi:glutamate racemase